MCSALLQRSSSAVRVVCLDQQNLKWVIACRGAQTRLGVVTCCPWAEPQLFSSHQRSHTHSEPSLPLSSELSAGTHAQNLSAVVSSPASERAECHTHNLFAGSALSSSLHAVRSSLPWCTFFTLVPSNPECRSVPFPLAQDVYCLLGPLFIRVFFFLKQAQNVFH